MDRGYADWKVSEIDICKVRFVSGSDYDYPALVWEWSGRIEKLPDESRDEFISRVCREAQTPMTDKIVEEFDKEYVTYIYSLPNPYLNLTRALEKSGALWFKQEKWNDLLYITLFVRRGQKFGVFAGRTWVSDPPASEKHAFGNVNLCVAER
jgi:hypothetical protein